VDVQEARNTVEYKKEEVYEYQDDGKESYNEVEEAFDEV